MRKLITILLFTVFASGLYPVEDPTLKFRQGKKAFERKQYDTAQTLFMEFLTEKPFEYEVRDTLFYLGEIYRDKKEYANAVSYYNRLTKRYPHSRYRKAIAFTTGFCYYHLNLHTKSKIYLLQYLEYVKDEMLNPGYYIDANILLGAIENENRQWRSAAQYYQNSILVIDRQIYLQKKNKELREKKRDILYALGIIYAERLNDKELAHIYLTGATELGQKITPGLMFLMRQMSLTHLTTENGLPDNSISDIQVDGDDVWISTWGGGLVRFSRSTQKFEKINLPSGQLRDLYVDFDTVYITSFDGIFIYDKKRSKTSKLALGNRIFNLAQKVFKDDRTIYFSTLMDGIIQYDTVKKSIEVLNENSFVGSNQVYAIEADHRYLAFGTLDKGAVVKNKTTGEIHYINVKNGKLDGNNVKTLLIDGRYLWIGVHRFGIYRYDLERKTIKFLDWDLPYPSCLARRGNKIWIGTSGHGIRVYDREKRTLDKITVLNGLSSNEVHHLQMEEDFIWIGYIDNGIDILYRPIEN